MTPVAAFYEVIFKSVGSKYASFAVSIVSTMILSRMFSPATYGVAAASQFYLLFVLAIAEGGIGPVIVSAGPIQKGALNALFSISVFGGLFLSLALIMLASILEELCGIRGVASFLRVSAVAVPFFSSGVIPLALLYRNKRFGQVAIGNAASEVVSTIVCVALAKFDSSVYALAFKIPAMYIVQFCFWMTMTTGTVEGRPTIGRCFTQSVDLMMSAGYQFAANIVYFFARYSDVYLVGKFMGPTPLGHYDRSLVLLRYPLTALTFAVQPAIQPALRSASLDFEKVANIHGHFSRRLFSLGIVVAVLMSVSAESLVRLFFGAEWIPTQRPMRILALSLPLQLALASSNSFFQALKRYDLLFGQISASALIMIIAAGGGIWIGEGWDSFCWAIVGGYYVNFFFSYLILYVYCFKVGFKKMIKDLGWLAIAWCPLSVLVFKLS